MELIETTLSWNEPEPKIREPVQYDNKRHTPGRLLKFTTKQLHGIMILYSELGTRKTLGTLLSIAAYHKSTV